MKRRCTGSIYTIIFLFLFISPFSPSPFVPPTLPSLFSAPFIPALCFVSRPFSSTTRFTRSSPPCKPVQTTTHGCVSSPPSQRSERHRDADVCVCVCVFVCVCVCVCSGCSGVGGRDVCGSYVKKTKYESLARKAFEDAFVP